MAGSVILLVLLFLIIAVITLLVLDYYGDRNTFAWHTQVICFVSFYIAFAIIVMLPLDLSSTKYRYCIKYNTNCEPPILDLDEDSLFIFWKTVYWISFNIQMFSNPVMAGYWRSGGFTPKRRLKDGVMENVVFYAQVGVPSVLFIIYAIFGLRIPVTMLLDLAIPAMNAFGLILLVLLLSYGLVEIPRDLWFSSNVEWRLRYIESTVPSLKEHCVDSEAEVYEVARILALASTKIPANDPLRSNLDSIMEKVCYYLC
jgi:LMBR1-like membrane protein